MPGYPAFLAGLYFLFGADPAVARVAQSILLGAAAALVALVARRVLGPARAPAAFLSFGLLPALFFYWVLNRRYRWALMLFVAG